MPDYEEYIDHKLNERIRKKLEARLFNALETSVYHNPYDQEMRELSAIEQGDPEALGRAIEENYLGVIGTLSKDPIRNMKDLSIVVITTASRAAILGGMLPEVSFSMSDLYIQEIEACASVEGCGCIMRSAEFQYTFMVRALKEPKRKTDPANALSSYGVKTPSQKVPDGDDRKDSSDVLTKDLPIKVQEAISDYAGYAPKTSAVPAENEHVSAAKNYIFRNLHRTLTAAEVADALGVNRNYLSGLFRRVTGETIKAYIIRNKIKLARNFLTYSSYSYSEITAYLGFASQSHLGTAFKKETGMTMGQYRKRYQMQEFLD